MGISKCVPLIINAITIHIYQKGKNYGQFSPWGLLWSFTHNNLIIFIFLFSYFYNYSNDIQYLNIYCSDNIIFTPIITTSLFCYKKTKAVISEANNKWSFSFPFKKSFRGRSDRRRNIEGEELERKRIEIN